MTNTVKTVLVIHGEMLRHKPKREIHALRE